MMRLSQCRDDRASIVDREALANRPEVLPSVIVIDIAMPRPRRHLASHGDCQLRGRILGLALTGRALENLASLFDIVLVKPVDPLHLCRAIPKIVASSTNGSAGNARHAAPTPGDLVRSDEGVARSPTP
jgi:hypothetical protein